MDAVGFLNLGALKSEGRRLFNKKEYAKALRTYDRILASVPQDNTVRLRIADVMAAAGREAQAAEIYRAVALHDASSGHPLHAMVAAHALIGLGLRADDIFQALTRHFASGSPHTTPFAVRSAAVDPRTAIPSRLSTDNAPFDQLVVRARSRALDLSEANSGQGQSYPLPFFSHLGAEAFLALVPSLVVRRLGSRELVIRQGERGDALYLVAAGQLRVFRSDGPAGEEIEVARIHEGSLFGEMALVTDETRVASVAVVDEADLIEVSRGTVEAVTSALPGVRDALERFTRDRLVRNLVASSPLFAAFTREQQAQLLQRFEDEGVDAGRDIIREGDPGMGLFIIAFGEVVVCRVESGGGETELARLGPGEIFGEMALLTGQPASATVRATRRTRLLFLSRLYIERLAADMPQVRTYFEQVVARRKSDNQFRLGRRSLPEVPIEIDFDHDNELLI